MEAEQNMEQIFGTKIMKLKSASVSSRPAVW